MAKKHKNTTTSSSGRPLETEDLDQIVGGATTAQYDAAKQALLGEMNNADITNAVAADAASIAANPSHIATAITDIESHAAADHVSEAAALAALDAATYGNAKVGGVDAVATELTKVLTSGTGEADMAHLAALGADPTTLVTELNQAVNVLAMGSSNGHTALGLSTTAAVDWVEAKLEVAAGNEANTDNAAAALQNTIAAANVFSVLPAGVTALHNAENAANADTAEAQAATALQTLLDTSHQGEVAEGKGIDAVMTALGSHAGQVAADAALLQGLTGAAAVTTGAQQVAAVEAIAGVQKDVELVALDLMAQGNAGVQQALSTELTSGAIESNLAQAVATGVLTGDQAVQTLNLVVADLAQNSVNAGTVPALEQGFAAAQADVALANAAGSLALSDGLASGYAANAALAAADAQQAHLATSLQTLINTNYASQVALVNELSGITAELGASAATYIAEGGNLIANPSLAAGYISAIEAAGHSAETTAVPGATNGAFSVDAALALLAIYSHGNSAVLAEINTRLVNGTAEADLANLVAIGTISSAQAVSTLSGMVDALAAASPNNAVTLTASDGHSITIDRGSAVDYAEALLTKAAVAAQTSLANQSIQDWGTLFSLTMSNLGSFFGGGASAAQVTAADNAYTAVNTEGGNVNQLVTLLETTHGNEVLQGLGIDTGWTATNASLDSAAAIAAGTHLVPNGYGGLTSTVDASATNLANSINAAAAGLANADFNLADSIMQLNLGQAATATAAQGGGDSAVESSTESLGAKMAALFGKGLSAAEVASSVVGGTAGVASDPSSLAAWGGLGSAIGTTAIMETVGLGEVDGVGTAAKGIEWLLDQNAVSHVLGTALSGQLAADFAFVAQVSDGITTMIGTALNVTASDGYTTAKDLGVNLATFSTDLYHGNFGALAGDAQTIITQFGSDMQNLTFDLVSGEQSALQGFANEIRQFFVNTANFIDGDHAPDWGSAIKWVDQQGNSILQDLINQGNTVSEIGSWFQNEYQDASKVLSGLSSGISNISSTVESSLQSFFGGISGGASDVWHDLTSWL
jgi:hypothetical protein